MRRFFYSAIGAVFFAALREALTDAFTRSISVETSCKNGR